MALRALWFHEAEVLTEQLPGYPLVEISAAHMRALERLPSQHSPCPSFARLIALPMTPDSGKDPPVDGARIRRGSAAAAVLGLGVLSWLFDGFVPVLDHANLAFHEAGHLVFGLLGPTLGLYGGTLGQLVFPAVVAGRGLLRQQDFEVALGLGWALQNLPNIARYMADARTQALPLVGGGIHDWTLILGRWGLLEWDQTLAFMLNLLAAVGFLVVAAWVLRPVLAVTAMSATSPTGRRSPHAGKLPGP
jgi:hypothetical protein